MTRLQSLPVVADILLTIYKNNLNISFNFNLFSFSFDNISVRPNLVIMLNPEILIFSEILSNVIAYISFILHQIM